MFFQFGLEALKQGKGVGRTTGKSCQYPVVIEAAYLAGITLHDGIAHGYLAVTADHDGITPANREDGCCV
jgi:hypothetical protein